MDESHCIHFGETVHAHYNFAVFIKDNFPQFVRMNLDQQISSVRASMRSDNKRRNKRLAVKGINETSLLSGIMGG